MALGTGFSYPFTDPLGAADGAPPEAHRNRARQALMALYLMGAATLAVTLITPDSNTSDHGGIAIIGLLMLSVSATLRVWRTSPDAVVLATYPLGIGLIAALVAVAEPIALIPIFYVWPCVLAAYFLQRREVALTFVLVAVSFAVVLRWWVVPDARMIQWVSIVVVGAVLTGLIVALKDRLAVALVGLRELAARDPLTGALNRRAFAEAIDAAVARVRRGEQPCAVAVLDIDRFKSINDRFGHAEGDRALRHLTTVVTERTRGADVVGRMGGEEFAVLLHSADAAGAARFGEDVRTALAALGDDPATSFTVSIGVAALDDGDGTAESMLLAADRALYTAKDTGRDRVVRATPRPSRTTG
ncbi:MAG TPA: GGDEF domain-containing protein [Baekduia sp.]|nr:GGDEF domain-containing protein [Baekduia sp.]